MRFKRFAKGHVRGRKVGMNKAEESYATRLAGEVLAGNISAWWYEPVSLKLSEGVRYTADFMVVAADDVIELHEVKAGRLNKQTEKIVPLCEDAGRAKFKVAREMFPFRFVMAWQYKGVWYFDREE